MLNQQIILNNSKFCSANRSSNAFAIASNDSVSVNWDAIGSSDDSKRSKRETEPVQNVVAELEVVKNPLLEKLLQEGNFFKWAQMMDKLRFVRFGGLRPGLRFTSRVYGVNAHNDTVPETLMEVTTATSKPLISNFDTFKCFKMEYT